MKLSIVMMVKNEEKYLDKTLSSLNPIREQIDSELIILDTGSTDKTVEIAKKYTDKVYFSEWNNNFADMRNKSISYAKGEWLLILDADEVIVEYDKLLEFFKTKKHKKYNSGTIQLYNIMSLEPIVKHTCRISRLFRNNSNFKYTGIVHEQPKAVGPIYNNIITCEHYGYLFQDTRLKRRKLERNRELLEKQLKTESNMHYYIYTHLAMTYGQLGRLADALYSANKAYELIKQRLTGTSKDQLYTFQYQSYISILIQSGEFKKAYEICLEYIKFDDKNLDILYNMSKITNILGFYDECIDYCNKFIYYIKHYDETSSYNSVYATCSSLDKNEEVYKLLVDCYLKSENYEIALDTIYDSDLKLDIFYSELIICLYKTDELLKLTDLYTNITKESKKVNFRLQLEKNIRTKFKKNDLQNIYHILANFKDEYGLFNQYRLNRIYTEDLDSIIINSNEMHYYQIIDIYMTERGNIPKILELLHNEKLQTALIYCLSNNFDFKFTLEDFMLNTYNTLDINLIRIYKVITQTLLLYGQLFEESYNMIFDLYLMYSNLYSRLINMNKKEKNLVYSVSTFEEMFIKELDNLKNIKDSVLYIRKLKKIAINYPNHKKSIDYLTKKFEKSLNETDKVKLLKKQFIDMISNNISKDNTQQIEVLLEQYKELYGIDKEILNLYGILDIYKEALDSAETNFKNALALDVCNPDTLYNIAYLKELKEEFEEAKLFYEFCRENTDEQDLINICNEKIDCLNNY